MRSNPSIRNVGIGEILAGLFLVYVAAMVVAACFIP